MDELTKMQQQIVAQKNRNLTLEFPVLDGDGNPLNLTGFKATFTVDDKAGVKQFERKNTAAGGGDTEIKFTDAGGGVLQVYLVPGSTANMAAGPEFLWDLTLEKMDYGIVTVAGGAFLLVETVT
jgi:hypothetical protein